MVWNKDFRENDIPDRSVDLVLTDIPYEIGNNAYASSKYWYDDEKRGTAFFETDSEQFDIPSYLAEAARIIKDRGAVFTFCAFEQIPRLLEEGKRRGLKKCLPFVAVKKTSPDVLKCNKRTCHFFECAILQWRDKLPYFNATGYQQKNVLDFVKGPENVIHPTQKPVAMLEEIIRRYTPPDGVVVDFCAGSGSTLIAAQRLGRVGFGFEINREFAERANAWLDSDDLQHF